jgi:hypothetical protein
MPNYSDTPSKFGCWLIPAVAETGATRTITHADLGKVITNRGGGALAITLPAPTAVPAGSWVMVYSVAAGDVSITSTDTVICLNNAAADAIGWTTAGEEIGNCALMVSLGSLWFAEMHIADEANTMTVTSA